MDLGKGGGHISEARKVTKARRKGLATPGNIFLCVHLVHVSEWKHTLWRSEDSLELAICQASPLDVFMGSPVFSSHLL